MSDNKNPKDIESPSKIENAFIGVLPQDTLANVQCGLALIGEVALIGDQRLELSDDARTGLYYLTRNLINALQNESNKN